MKKPKHTQLIADHLTLSPPSKKEIIQGAELMIELENTQYKMKIGIGPDHILNFYKDIRRVVKGMLRDKASEEEDLLNNTEEEEEEESLYRSQLLPKKQEWKHLYI